MGRTLKLSPESALLAMTIPFGRDKAISREALTELLHTSDRVMRRMIQHAREEGLIILNAQDGSGYFQSADLADMEAQYRQDTARAMAILKRRKHLRRILKEAGKKV